MEDVIETVLGIEIVDESDRTADMQVLAQPVGNAARGWFVVSPPKTEDPGAYLGYRG